MKRNYKITSYILLGVTAMLSLSSCLKDSGYIDFSKNEPLVEFPLEANSGQFQSAAFDISSTPSTLQVAVNVASPAPLTSALDVTVSVDQATLDAYNSANSTNYLVLPSADYALPAKVTVPANQRLGILNITIYTDKIDPSGSFALPLKITDASGKKISNYNTLIYSVGVKNKYDGVYTVTGTMNDVVNPALTSNYPRTVDLVTTGANTNAYFDEGLSGFAHAILNGGTLSSYGQFAPVFTFDSNNKVTAVVNKYGQPSGNNRSARLDITGINAVSGTPGTSGSVIKVKYVMVQGTDRTFFDETFTYKSAR
ncbi:DUF1735 domain-containing protein [Mucilaginibacter achroorhodeus]|uniref:DUF1735 domain-containing protein n=1 Tax=Mucilaginibacter achroorhodeus TaxID=2599294 RepID=A0A563UBF8_9SPHI|nr:DUF1735 domain-containing protein [Mucilaginibacter achroorhodeus]TWR28623.1 DUF1735 domain-containing protein [Mucilaginibacter achroorhodeus]